MKNLLLDIRFLCYLLFSLSLFLLFQIRTLLADSTTWKFDIIALERLTEHRPLVWLGMTVLTRSHFLVNAMDPQPSVHMIDIRFEVPRTLGIEESVIQNWLTLIEANYRSGNTYHNSRYSPVCGKM